MRRALVRRKDWRSLWAPALLLCFLVATAGPADAEQPALQPSAWPEVMTLEEAARFLRVSPAELAQLADWREVPGRRVGAYWRFSRTALLAWLAGDWRATAAAVPQPPQTAPLTQMGLSYVTGRGTTLAEAEPPSLTGKEEPEPIGEAPKERTAEEVFLRGQRVLLAPGEVTLDLGLFYSESDDRRLVSVSGGTGLGTIEQETFTTTLIGRYGLFEETEVFASSSFRDQDTGVFFGNTQVSDSGRSEFGDVRLGLRRTVLREDVGIPDVILTLDGRIPTDDTSYAVGGGIALVKSIDPVVLFANANYRHTFSRDFADVTRLEPADRIDATFGYAYALNDTLTLSTSLSGLFTSATSFENAELRQRDLFSLQFGLTSLLTKNLYIEPTVSFGLNGPGDSFAIGVSLPYTFEP